MNIFPLNITKICFDRVALIDAGWDINDNPDHHSGSDYREIEAWHEHPKSTLDSSHQIRMTLHERGNTLVLMNPNSDNEEHTNRILDFLVLTKTPYTTH